MCMDVYVYVWKLYESSVHVHVTYVKNKFAVNTLHNHMRGWCNQCETTKPHLMTTLQ